ncbi:ribonuclease J [Vulgatibacter incomptus]|uniref:Ribonuclease J n=1 Tax=Vulgatibacter incomptus TaxID=1391653 RepID=A0A0K1PII4_9BACT|nr:ribonuclease J [Vulgatibacter incomptus]AKU89626.1 Ribonuclease J2 (endoribonuclease in RNA processing) [Vulgatibacter incomptus]AKU93330.1 Ribonuclease J2 (endoribonuclease in RNA processing) [Vulgatibacter incomptus]
MLRIIPLGGLGEVGLNAMVFESEDQAFLVDCGIMFPQAEALGVDVVLPDFTYLRELGDKLKGVVLTHGHEDHIGALPFLLKDRPLPVYGSPFTLGLLAPKLEEFGIRAPLTELAAGSSVDLGEAFRVEGVRVTHSIPDALGLAIHTPEGLVVHTGDFKIDHSPIDELPTDLQRFARLGGDGILALLSDSTNSERPGTSLSERQVGRALEEIFAKAKSRVVIATFASNIHRIQQVLDVSRLFGRKVVLVGRSMQQNTRIASELGLLDIPLGLVVDVEEGRRLRHHEVTVLSTGAQGEPRSALMRMALGDPNAPMPVDEGDLVVLSSRFIPGNEVAIGHMVNRLAMRGAEVVYEGAEDLHASGHAYREEQRLMLRITNPRHFVPIHGEYRHLVRHVKTAHEVGIPDSSCHLITDGEVLQFEGGRAFVNGTVASGRVYVDRRGGPDVPELTLRERALIAETGLVTAVVVIDRSTGALVRGPELTARGIAVPDEAALLADVRREVHAAVESLSPVLRGDTTLVQEEVRRAVRRAYKRSTERKPVVLPLVIEL